MSATIDCKQFADYFSTVIQGRMFPAYVFEVDGRAHRIDEFYMDDLQLFPLTVKQRQTIFLASPSFYVQVKRWCESFRVFNRWTRLMVMTLTFQRRCTMWPSV